MSLVVGTNTWATLAEADTYLTNKVGSTSWFSLEDTPATPGAESKESFMLMAYNLLLNKGGFCIYSGLTATNVKYAQIEMAYHMAISLKDFEDNANRLVKGVSKFTLSKWTEEYSASYGGDFSLPYIVSNYLQDYRMDSVIIDVTVE